MIGSRNVEIARQYHHVVTAIVGSLILGVPCHAVVRHVDALATGAQNGTTWSDAYTSLQSALTAAVAGDEIWVATGKYRPAGTGAPRTSTFQLKTGVALYGGFPVGGGTFAQRDSVAFPTTLSGDLNANDIATMDPLHASVQDNAFHVMTGSGTTNTAGVDGFIVTRGFTDLAGSSLATYGGGMLNVAGNPTIAYCVFTSNWGKQGGGMSNRSGSQPSIVNCIFSANIASGAGGAMHNEDARPAMTDCLFQGNTATSDGGGAVMNVSSGNPGLPSMATFLRCDFISNSTLQSGAAVGGAVRSQNPISVTFEDCTFISCNGQSGSGAIHQDEGSLSLIDCVFTGNTAPNGVAGALSHTGPNTGATTITECVFLQNSARNGGGAIRAASVSFLATSCEFMNNSVAVGSSLGGAVQVSSAAKWVDCQFIGNTSAQRGGAVWVGGSTPSFLRCVFEGNQASEGGAAYLHTNGNAVFASCLFVDNHSNFDGGAARASSCTPRYMNCVFTGNTTNSSGGAMYNAFATPAVISNCTFANNSATGLTGGIVNHSMTSPTMVNTILWGNVGSGGSNQASQISGGMAGMPVNFCTIQGWTGSLGGTGNGGGDPQLADADGADNLPGTSDDDLRLLTGSPSINTGNNASIPADAADVDGDSNVAEPLPLDYDGNARVIASSVDQGAFEATGGPSGPGVFVGLSGGSWNVAANWSGNAVPGPGTTVFVTTIVLINQPGAQALSVNIVNGGALQVNGGSLAASTINVTSGGDLTIASAGSVTTTALLIESAGTLAMNAASATLQCAGGTINAGSTLNLNAGLLWVSAGHLNAVPALNIGCSGGFELRVAAAASCTAPQVTICANGRLSGAGSINGQVINAGVISPGSSIGTLTIVGSLQMSASGTCELEVDALQPAAPHDLLIVNGTVQVDGTLLVPVANLATASPAELEVLRATTISGSFDTVTIGDPVGPFLGGMRQTSGSVHVGPSLPGPRTFVNASGPPGGTGVDWSTALPELELALKVCRLSSGNIVEIWVTEGAYLPTYLSNPNAPLPQLTATFLLPAGVTIYGGFVGTETAVAERDVANHPTILSGDLAGDDEPDFTNRADNARRVVTAVDLAGTATLDGFRVRGANFGNGVYCTSMATLRLCEFTDNFGTAGAGVMNDGGSMVIEDCSFTANSTICDGCGNGTGAGIANIDGGTIAVDGCAFSQNVSGEGSAILNGFRGHATVSDSDFVGNVGIALLSDDAALELSDSTFTDNTGTCVSITSAFSDPDDPPVDSATSITGCLFEDNNGRGIMIGGRFLNDDHIADCDFLGNHGATEGGALAIDKETGSTFDRPTITGCTFDGNTAIVRGGAVLVISNQTANLAAEFTNCTFTNNVAGVGPALGQGGAVLSNIGITTPNVGPTFANCTFTGNTASAEGGAIRNQTASITLTACSFADNTAPLGNGMYNVFRGTVRGSASFGAGQDIVSTDSIRPGLLPPGSPFGLFASGGQLAFVDRGPDFNDHPTLSVDVGGTTFGLNHDGIDAVTGSAVLTGLLQVTFVNGFQPGLGDVIDVVRSPDVQGQFGVATFPAVAAGLLMTTQYSSTGVSLTVEQIEAFITFADPTSLNLPGTPTGGALGDFDNDGDLDLVLCIPSVPAGSGGTAYLLRNGGTNAGQWAGFNAISQPMNVGIDPRAVAVGFLDGDSWLDFAVANRGSSTVTHFKNAGTGAATFLAPMTIGLSASPASVTSGNLDRGRDELFVPLANNQIDVLRFDSAGVLAGTTSVQTLDAPSLVAAADLDNDGDDDLIGLRPALPPNASQTDVFTYDSGSGTFDTAITYTTGVGAAGLLAADLNNDTYDDVVVADTVGGNLVVLVNTGGGAVPLATPISVAMGPSPTQLAAIDAEPDGDVDVMAVVQSGGPVIRLARNDLNQGQTIIFNAFNDLVTNASTAILLCDDVNLDNVSDVLSVNSLGAFGLVGGVPLLEVRLNDDEQLLCPADIAPIDGDGVVNVQDLLAIIAGWGACANPNDCPADIAPPTSGDNVVNVQDLLAVISDWGMCP